MIDPLVRPARPSDAAALDALQAEFREAAALLRGGAVWLRENSAVAAWDGHLDDVVVAEIDDVVVGYLRSTLSNDGVLGICEVWVTPDARELGFGDELLAATIERGRARGATAVQGQALPGDRHTKNLYERAGIVARLIVTYRDLGAGGVSDPASSAAASR